MDEMVGVYTVVGMADVRYPYKFLSGKMEGKGLLERPRYRREHFKECELN